MRDIISVVAGGWSFAEVDPAKVPGYVIAVNESGVLLPRVDCIVSMDRLWSENRWDRLTEMKKHTYLRRAAVQNIEPRPNWLHVFDCDHTSVEFKEATYTLNGNNSGTCAIGLAHKDTPRELYLFGFDMCRAPDGRAYWHAPYPWTKETGGTSNGKYNAWAQDFATIARQFALMNCKVFNVSRHSKITQFRRVTPEAIGVAR